MFGDFNGQIKLRTKQRFKFLSATTEILLIARDYAVKINSGSDAIGSNLGPVTTPQTLIMVITLWVSIWGQWLCHKHLDLNAASIYLRSVTKSQTLIHF